MTWYPLWVCKCSWVQHSGQHILDEPLEIQGSRWTGRPRAVGSTSYTRVMVSEAQLPGQLVDLRTPGILESRVGGDPNVLGILTFSRTLDRKDLGSISNGIAEDYYKDDNFPCLYHIQKLYSTCITLSDLDKELLVTRQVG